LNRVRRETLAYKYGRSDLGRLADRAERFGLRLSRADAVAEGPAAESAAASGPDPQISLSRS
jgi:hypothetical protein